MATTTSTVGTAWTLTLLGWPSPVSSAASRQALEDDMQAMRVESITEAVSDGIDFVCGLIPSGKGSPASVGASLVLLGLMSSKAVWLQNAS